MKTLPPKETIGPDDFTGKLYKTLKGEIILILNKVSQISGWEHFPTYFPWPPKCWYQNHKGTKSKLQNNTVMNKRYKKSSRKYIKNQQHIKRTQYD